MSVCLLQITWKYEKSYVKNMSCKSSFTTSSLSFLELEPSKENVFFIAIQQMPGRMDFTEARF